MLSRGFCLLLCFGLLSSLGCDSGPKIVKVKGRVTYDGKPVTAGKIFFMPAIGKPAYAEIQTDGTYVLTTLETFDGACVGDHVVSITALKQDESKKDNTGKKGGPAPPPINAKLDWLVPQVYSSLETSKLRAKVENKENEINFDIPKE